MKKSNLRSNEDKKVEIIKEYGIIAFTNNSVHKISNKNG